MSVQYDWRPGAHIARLDPQAAGDELERIREKHGTLSPALVLREAKSKRNPLHDYLYGMPDTEAAQRWRVERAGHLIRCVVIRRVNNKETPPVRAYVSVRTTPEADQPEYVATTDARNDPYLREQLLTKYRVQLARVAQQIKDFEEFAGVVRAIHEAQEALAVAA